jgi:hypothetical protein
MSMQNLHFAFDFMVITNQSMELRMQILYGGTGKGKVVPVLN